MKRFFKSISPLLAIVVLSLASWALCQELRNYRWREFRESLRQIPLSRIGWAVLLVGLDYTILVGNDWVASRIVGWRVPLVSLAMGSIAGYAASHNLGAAFGGTPVRYRFYSSWGVPPPQIAVWIAMLAMSFAMGASMAGGVACLAHPMASPEQFPLSADTVRWLGSVLLVLPIGYVTACAFFRSPVRLRKWTIHFPPLKLAALQVIVGSADLCCAAGILYVLLPPDAAIGYPAFLTVYLLAIVAAVCSHVPGGVGVFDLMTIKLLDRGDPHDVLAALLVYRTVFYLLPLGVGLVLFTVHELRRPHAPSSTGQASGTR